MKKFKYNGDFGIDTIEGKEITWIKGHIYTDLPENNKKIKQLMAQKKLVMIQEKQTTKTKKGQK